MSMRLTVLEWHLVGVIVLLLIRMAWKAYQRNVEECDRFNAALEQRLLAEGGTRVTSGLMRGMVIPPPPTRPPRRPEKAEPTCS